MGVHYGGARSRSIVAPDTTQYREPPLPIRSLLYVPVSSERFLAKAHERGADAIILDLEDAVAPARKDAARARLSEAVAMARRGGATIFVRINSEPARIRLDAEAACRAGAFGLLVPKTESRMRSPRWRIFCTVASAHRSRPDGPRADDRRPGRGARRKTHRNRDAAHLRLDDRRRGPCDRTRRRADARGPAVSPS